MRLLALLFPAILTASAAGAGQTPASSPGEIASPIKDQEPQAADHGPGTKDQGPAALPVSLEKIRGALESPPALSLQTLDERPTFRVMIRDRQKIEELLTTLDFKAGPVPAGGIYMAEQNRVMFPWVDNPERQQFGAFSQGQLLTILIENLVGKYLAHKTLGAVSKSERSHAEAEAKEEVHAAVLQYCSAQPRQGAGIQICDTAIR